MKYITVLIVFCFSVLFAYDYFPTIAQVVEVPRLVFIMLVIGLFLVSMLFNRNTSGDNKNVLKWQVFITTYSVFLMGLFTILGGESDAGISFNNGFFWVVLLFSLYEIFTQWKKVKSSQSL